MINRDVQIQCLLYQVSQMRLVLQKRFRVPLKKTGLELNDFYSLTIIFEQNIKTASELSRQLQFSPATVSVILKKMLRKKLISIAIDPNDGKQKIITVTEFGKKNWVRAKSILSKIDHDLNLNFGMEIRQFRKFYHKFILEGKYEK